jgi:hypothetical protein
MKKPTTVWNKWNRIPKKNRNARLGREMAKECGMRSMAEVRCAADMDKRKIEYEYEPHTLSYQYKPQSYTPDFWLPEHGFYVEVKGKMTDDIRKKMLSVKDCNSDIDIAMVFERAANKIRKGSPTTYAKWCERKGIEWSEHIIDDKWLR